MKVDYDSQGQEALLAMQVLAETARCVLSPIRADLIAIEDMVDWLERTFPLDIDDDNLVSYMRETGQR